MRILDVIRGTKLIEMIRKEYYLLLRRRKFMVMVLALPILLGAVFALSTSLTSLGKINIGICDFDKSPQTNQMVQSLQQQFTVEILPEDGCIDIMGERIKQEQFLLGINIPQGFSDKLNKLQQATIYLYFDNSKPQLATTLDYLILRGLTDYKSSTLSGAQSELSENIEDIRETALTVQSVVNASSAIIPGPTFLTIKQQTDDFVDLMNLLYEMDIAFLADPVHMEKRGIYPEVNTLAVSFAIVFCILSLFSSFMLCSTNLIFDRDNNFIIMVKTSGSSFFTYITSKLVVFNGVALLQLGLVFVIFLAMGAVFSIDLISLSASFLIISSLNILIGMTIGLISENETVAVLTSLIFTLPFLFLSGAFFPTELFPDAIRLVTDVFPLNIEIILLKKVVTFAFPISQLASTMNILIYYFIFFFGLNWFILRNKKK